MILGKAGHGITWRASCNIMYRILYIFQHLCAMFILGMIIEMSVVKRMAFYSGFLNLLIYAQIPMGLLVKTSHEKLKKIAISAGDTVPPKKIKDTE